MHYSCLMLFAFLRSMNPTSGPSKVSVHIISWKPAFCVLSIIYWLKNTKRGQYYRWWSTLCTTSSTISIYLVILPQWYQTVYRSQGGCETTIFSIVLAQAPSKKLWLKLLSKSTCCHHQQRIYVVKIYVVKIYVSILGALAYAYAFLFLHNTIIFLNIIICLTKSFVTSLLLECRRCWLH